MKIALPLLLVVIGCTRLAAQPTLTAATNNPVIGDVLYFHTCDTAHILAGTAGPAAVWNFAALSQTGLDTTVYISCASSPYCDSFPGSNIVATDLHGNYSYYTTSSSAFSYLGYRTATASRHYSDPLAYVRFPMTYNTATSDSGSFSFATGTVTYVDTFICDGYGTLTLPTGTLSNVLRVHEIQYGFQTGAVPFNWRYDYYQWYVAGLHAPVLYMGFDTTGTGTTHINYVGYTPKLSQVSIVSPGSSASVFRCFPNPANEVLHIETPGGVSGSYLITNSLGVMVLRGMVDASAADVDIRNISPGAYFVRFTGLTGNATGRFVKD